MTVGTTAQTGVDTSVDVLDANGQKTGTANLPAAVFGVQTNVPLIHQVVVAQQAAARQGTHSTKTRGDVRGGGKKPYRQKGTGRARQGSLRAPQFTGGGTVHGPTPRDYTQRTPKKMKAAALRGALSDRARHGRVHVLSSLVTGDAPSTKAALSAVSAVTDRVNVLVVLQREDELGWKSLRNVAGVHVIVSDQLNTYDVLCADDVLFTEGALAEFLAGSGGTSPASGRYPHRSPGRKGKGGAATATEDEAQQVFARDTVASQDAAAADDAAAENDVEAGE